MKAEHVLATLRIHETDLRAHGVTHVALFGSTARGEATSRSDVDILVDLDPEVVVTVFDYAGVKAYIAGLFDAPVDVASRDGLKPRIRPAAERDAIYAF